MERVVLLGETLVVLVLLALLVFSFRRLLNYQSHMPETNATAISGELSEPSTIELAAREMTRLERVFEAAVNTPDQTPVFKKLRKAQLRLIALANCEPDPDETESSDDSADTSGGLFDEFDEFGVDEDTVVH